MSLNEICKEFLETAKEAYNNGITAGGEMLKAELSSHYQNDKWGARKNYSFAFYGVYWDDTCYNAFVNQPITGKGSNVFIQAFRYAKITNTKVPIHINDTIALDRTWADCSNLQTIEELVIENDSGGYYQCFNNCNSLQNIKKITGNITGDGLDFKHCDLTPQTMMNIFEALKQCAPDYFTKTIIFNDNDWNKFTDFYSEEIQSHGFQTGKDYFMLLKYWNV